MPWIVSLTSLTSVLGGPDKAACLGACAVAATVRKASKNAKKVRRERNLVRIVASGDNWAGVSAVQSVLTRDSKLHRDFGSRRQGARYHSFRRMSGQDVFLAA